MGVAPIVASNGLGFSFRSEIILTTQDKKKQFQFQQV